MANKNKITNALLTILALLLLWICVRSILAPAAQDSRKAGTEAAAGQGNESTNQ